MLAGRQPQKHRMGQSRASDLMEELQNGQKTASRLGQGLADEPAGKLQPPVSGVNIDGGQHQLPVLEPVLQPVGHLAVGAGDELGRFDVMAEGLHAFLINVGPRTSGCPACGW